MKRTGMSIAVLSISLPMMIAHAAEAPGLRPGPSLISLQRAAVATARLEPERIDRWERRMHVAGLAPSLRLRVMRGGTDLLSTSDYNGNTRLTVGDHNAWQFEVAATWALERLVWHPDEMRVAREAQRMALHREKLLVEVASLDAERRRLLRGIARQAAGGALHVAESDAEEAQLRLIEVEAVLDGLTGGLFSRTVSGETKEGDVPATATTRAPAIGPAIPTEAEPRDDRDE